MRRHWRTIPVLWLLAMLIISSSCSTGIVSSPMITGTPAQSIKDITVTQTYELIQSNRGNKDFIIIDIRTPEEFSTGHIENAVLIDYYASNFETEIGKLDRNKKYLIYCRTARRSAAARDIMKEMGFTDLFHMEGGITDWISKNYPVVI